MRVARTTLFDIVLDIHVCNFLMDVIYNNIIVDLFLICSVMAVISDGNTYQIFIYEILDK